MYFLVNAREIILSDNKYHMPIIGGAPSVFHNDIARSGVGEEAPLPYSAALAHVPSNEPLGEIAVFQAVSTRAIGNGHCRVGWL